MNDLTLSPIAIIHTTYNVKWRIKAGTVNCVEVIEIEKDK